jgi:S-adenosylmethionine/arginine decarboxylase-like enzyme
MSSIESLYSLAVGVVSGNVLAECYQGDKETQDAINEIIKQLNKAADFAKSNPKKLVMVGYNEKASDINNAVAVRVF